MRSHRSLALIIGIQKQYIFVLYYFGACVCLCDCWILKPTRLFSKRVIKNTVYRWFFCGLIKTWCHSPLNQKPSIFTVTDYDSAAQWGVWAKERWKESWWKWGRTSQFGRNFWLNFFVCIYWAAFIKNFENKFGAIARHSDIGLLLLCIIVIAYWVLPLLNLGFPSGFFFLSFLLLLFCFSSLCELAKPIHSLE